MLLSSGSSGFAKNRLQHEGILPNETLIALHVLNMIEELLRLPRDVNRSSSITLRNSWIQPEFGTLKVNTDVTFLEGKFDIEILVRNHLGISILAKFVPRNRWFVINYGKLVGVIEGYTVDWTNLRSCL